MGLIGWVVCGFVVGFVGGMAFTLLIGVAMAAKRADEAE
jgi:hypothetical protein